MRDDTPLMLTKDQPGRATAQIIAFPVRTMRASGSRNADVATAIAAGLDQRSQPHAPTLLAASGALAGFAVQQEILLEGGSAWAQPMRATRLDNLLLSDAAKDASLWWTLCVAAHELGAQHLPDPKSLLASTLKCVGTSQLGQITMPLEYRLNEQPQTALVRLWARTRTMLDDAGVKSADWPRVMAALCAERVIVARRDVPAHVALRVVLQAALGMALIEPRLIPGAALKAE